MYGKTELITRTIWVTFQKEGIHAYPAAATDARLVDVAFLANPHRHMFHFKVSISVVHNDRDIEFILFKRWLESLYDQNRPGKALELDNKSCEMIAEELIRYIDAHYPGRHTTVDVSEDGENGAVISLSQYHQPIRL